MSCTCQRSFRRVSVSDTDATPPIKRRCFIAHSSSLSWHIPYDRGILFGSLWVIQATQVTRSPRCLSNTNVHCIGNHSLFRCIWSCLQNMNSFKHQQSILLLESTMPTKIANVASCIHILLVVCSPKLLQFFSKMFLSSMVCINQFSEVSYPAQNLSQNYISRCMSLNYVRVQHITRQDGQTNISHPSPSQCYPSYHATSPLSEWRLLGGRATCARSSKTSSSMCNTSQLTLYEAIWEDKEALEFFV